MLRDKNRGNRLSVQTLNEHPILLKWDYSSRTGFPPECNQIGFQGCKAYVAREPGLMMERLMGKDNKAALKTPLGKLYLPAYNGTSKASLVGGTYKFRRIYETD